MTREEFMESLGWGFFPTGPNEWEWLKFENEKLIARQGDETWKADNDRYRPK